MSAASAAAADYVHKHQAAIERIVALLGDKPRVLLLANPGAGRYPATRRVHESLGRFEEGSDEHVVSTWLHHGARLTSDGVRDSDGNPMRPFRAPHHTVSEIGMLGVVERTTAMGDWQRSGKGKPPPAIRRNEVTGHVVRPGELSLSHGGTLMLDQVEEWRRGTLLAVLGVLQDGYVDYHAHHDAHPVPHSLSLRLPARPRRVVATMLACACGYDACRCTAGEIVQWVQRTAVVLDDMRRAGFDVVEVER